MGITDITSDRRIVAANITRTDGTENDIMYTSSELANGVNLKRNALIIPITTPTAANDAYSAAISPAMLIKDAPTSFFTAMTYMRLSI